MHEPAEQRHAQRHPVHDRAVAEHATEHEFAQLGFDRARRPLAPPGRDQQIAGFVQRRLALIDDEDRAVLVRIIQKLNERLSARSPAPSEERP